MESWATSILLVAVYVCITKKPPCNPKLSCGQGVRYSSGFVVCLRKPFILLILRLQRESIRRLGFRLINQGTSLSVDRKNRENHAWGSRLALEFLLTWLRRYPLADPDIGFLPGEAIRVSRSE